MITLLFVGIVLIAGGFVLYRRSGQLKAFAPKRRADGKRRLGSSNANPTRPIKPFQAVKIMGRLDACKAATQMGDQTMLAAEAPALPLPGCDASQCACRYVHLDDRRQDDRRFPIATTRSIWDASERRDEEADRRSAEAADQA